MSDQISLEEIFAKVRLLSFLMKLNAVSYDRAGDPYRLLAQINMTNTAFLDNYMSNSYSDFDD